MLELHPRWENILQIKIKAMVEVKMLPAVDRYIN